MAKWESYKKGTLTKEMTGLLEKINNKEWRKENGLEDQPLRDFKNKDHWVMYVLFQLAEAQAKHFDEIVKGTYLALDNQTAQFSRRVNADAKKSVTSLQRQNTTIGTEMTKKFKQSAMRQNKVLANVDNVLTRTDALAESVTDDILKASKGIIKATNREMTQLRGNIEVETDEVRDTVSKVEENLLDFLNRMDSDITKNIKSKVAEISRSVQLLNQESQKRVDGLSAQADEKHAEVDGKLDDIMQKFHASLRELGGNFNTGMKEFGDHNMVQQKQIMSHLTSENQKQKEIIDHLVDIVKTNHNKSMGILNKHQEETMNTIQNNQKETQRILQREIKEVRDLVANIRGDIEMIKSFLTKM